MAAPLDTSLGGSYNLNGGRANATNSNSTYFEHFEMVLLNSVTETKLRLQRIQQWAIIQIQ